jgi:hypothetical protein
MVRGPWSPACSSKPSEEVNETLSKTPGFWDELENEPSFQLVFPYLRASKSVGQIPLEGRREAGVGTPGCCFHRYMLVSELSYVWEMPHVKWGEDQKSERGLKTSE